jgi:HSP20 family protein
MEVKSLTPASRWSNMMSSVADPFVSLRRDMDRMFESFAQSWGAPAELAGSTFLAPKVNVAETEAGLEITAEMPGIDQKDIEIDLTDGVLTLKAEHTAEKKEDDEKKRYHLVERSHGAYLRRFTLPFEADVEKAEAAFDKGVLTVHVPRAATMAKPTHKIAIKAA